MTTENLELIGKIEIPANQVNQVYRLNDAAEVAQGCGSGHGAMFKLMGALAQIVSNNPDNFDDDLQENLFFATSRVIECIDGDARRPVISLYRPALSDDDDDDDDDGD